MWALSWEHQDIFLNSFFPNLRLQAKHFATLPTSPNQSLSPFRKSKKLQKPSRKRRTWALLGLKWPNAPTNGLPSPSTQLHTSSSTKKNSTEPAIWVKRVCYGITDAYPNPKKDLSVEDGKVGGIDLDDDDEDTMDVAEGGK